MATLTSRSHHLTGPARPGVTEREADWPETWHHWPPVDWPGTDNDAAWQNDAEPKAKPKWRTCSECRRNYSHLLQDGLCRRCYGRATAIETAQQWLADDPLFLEVNSTGLGDADQIVEVALLDSDGKALLNTLVKPTVPMTVEAAALNGLTDGALAAAPGFAAVTPTLYALLTTRRVVVYDVRYDTRLLAQSGSIAPPPGIVWSCAMELYAQYAGLWNAHFDNYRWQKLEDAATWFNLKLPAPRRAAHGAETARRILRFMAGVETPPEVAWEDDERGEWQW